MRESLVLGWSEWIALPDLGLHAIKAKIDTGARTSALHASDIEDIGAGMVRFKVLPHPRRPDLVVDVETALIEHRKVTSSNGDRELRPVIGTTIQIAGRSWPIEVTLTNRETMRTRMLLGRQALQGGILIDPARAFRQPKLGFKLYPDYRPRRGSAS